MTFDEKVEALTQIQLQDIETHYYDAIETSHGSGNHWILMSVLDKYGFRTNNPIKAVKLAEEIVMLWYSRQK